MTTRNRIHVTLGAAAILLAAAGFWAGKSLTTATLTPTVQTGTVALVGINGDEFTIQLSGQHQLTSYGLPSSTTWRNAYGVWQLGSRPGCMAPLSRGQRIRFGVVNVAPAADAPGSPVVVWIECPSQPIPRYPIVTPPTASGLPAPGQSPSARQLAKAELSRRPRSVVPITLRYRHGAEVPHA